MLNQRPGLAWAAVAAVFLLLIAWGPTHALRTLWGIALLGALVAVGVVALRHQTLRGVPFRPGAHGRSPGPCARSRRDRRLTSWETVEEVGTPGAGR